MINFPSWIQRYKSDATLNKIKRELAYLKLGFGNADRRDINGMYKTRVRRTLQLRRLQLNARSSTFEMYRIQCLYILNTVLWIAI